MLDPVVLAATSTAAPPVTVTIAVAVARANCASILEVRPRLTDTSACSYLPNPGASIATLYLPGGRALIRYLPSSPVVAFCDVIRFRLVAVIVAPLTTCPFGSVTDPSIEPVVLDWPM